MSKELYTKRKELLLSYYQKHKELPSYDELVKVFGLKSKGSLHKYVEKFIDDGLLEKGGNGRLIPTTKLYGIRVLGTVQAGFPSPAEEELADTMSLDEYLIEKPNSTFLLTVTGDSMIEAGIMQGDMVLIERGKRPQNGDIVVAEVDHEWTMKYYVKNGRGIILRPANKEYPDIKPQEELKLAGIVTSVIRKY